MKQIEMKQTNTKKMVTKYLHAHVHVVCILPTYILWITDITW